MSQRTTSWNPAEEVGHRLWILHGMVPQGRSRLGEGHEVRVLGGLPDRHHAGKGHLARRPADTASRCKGDVVTKNWRATTGMYIELTFERRERGDVILERAALIVVLRGIINSTPSTK